MLTGGLGGEAKGPAGEIWKRLAPTWQLCYNRGHRGWFSLEENKVNEVQS